MFPTRNTVLSVAVLSGCVSGTPDPRAPDALAINQSDVERIVSVLAADDMRGRHAFADDALRAADFLVDEFRDAGLTPWAQADGYLQPFAIQAIRSGEASVTIDGTALSRDRFAVRAGAPSLAWSTGDATVSTVGAGDDAQRIVLGAINSGNDALVLFDDSQAEPFHALVQLFRTPVRFVDGGVGSSVIIALSDGTIEATYQVTAASTIVDEPLANVVGMVAGRRSDELVLFSAHYDHIGIRPTVDGDSIANGANDNASGTTAVVTLAKYFAARGTPERTLLFAAFTAEEGGGYGSRYFSTQLNPDQVVAMFNIEMIGKPAVGGPNTAWITGFERSSFGPLLQQAVVDTEYEFYADPYPTQNLFYRSDNATLAHLGVPAHSISTTPIDVDRDYHQVSDHVETLDLAHMANTIRAIAMGAGPMISGEATPTRVDPATVNR